MVPSGGTSREAMAATLEATSMSDEQVELLRAIWNEMKALNGRVDKTNTRLDDTHTRLADTSTRLDGTNERLGETNARLDGLRSELRAEIGGLRGELKAEIGGLRGELKAEIGAVRRDVASMHEELARVHSRSLERDKHLAGAISALSVEVSDVKLDVRELTAAVHSWHDDHRLDREELRARVDRLERHVGIGPDTR
jgi:chromosome segregation ATPase